MRVRGSGSAGPEALNRAASRDTVALLASRVLIAALGWAGSIVIARVLSPTEWGQYSFVFALLGLLSVITDLGVGRVVLARLVEDDAPDAPLVASSFIALRVLLGMVGYVVALGYVLLLDYPGEVVRATALGGVVVIIATPSHALTMLFQSRLRLAVVAAAEAIGQTVQLGLTVFAALVAPSLLVFVLPVIVNELVKVCLKLRGVRRGDTGARPARRVELWRWRGMLIDAIPLTIGTAFATLLYRIDVLLLSRLDTFESVGMYTVGYKFADVLALVTSAVLSPALTLLVLAWSKDVEAFRERVRHAYLLLLLLASVTLAGFWASAAPVITTLYGERFGPATSSARLLLAGACLAMLTQVGFTVLVASGHQRFYPWVGAVGLTLNVALNLVLIPEHSYRGAAAATVVTEVVVFGVMWVLVVRNVRVPGLFPVRQLMVMTSVTVVVVVVAEALDGFLPWPLLVAGPVAAVLVAAWALHLPGTRTAGPALLQRLQSGPSR